MARNTLLWQIARKLFIILLTILTFAAVPFILATTTLVLILRQAGILFSKLYWNSSSILKIVDSTCQAIVNDHLVPNPRFTILYTWIGEGNMSLEFLRDNVMKNILEKRNQNKKLVYPELKCYTTRIGGYFYWKKDPDFSIKNHVKAFTPEELKNCNVSKSKDSEDHITSEGDLKKIFTHLMSKPWERDRCPWEFLLINNYVDGEDGKMVKMVAILRIHHFLGDGYCIRDLLTCLHAGEYVDAVPSKTKGQRKTTIGKGIRNFGKALKQVGYFLSMPYHFAVMADQLLNLDPHCWKVPKSKRKLAGQKMYQEWSGRVSISDVKLIKNKFQTSFNAVILSVMSGAMQKMMLNLGQEVPESVTAIVPVPVTKHPGGLCNHFGLLPICLPVGETDRFKRLSMVSKETKDLANTQIPAVSYILYRLVGLYPPILTRYLISVDVGHSVGLSIFTAYNGECYVGPHKHLDGFFTIGAGQGDTGAFLTTFSQLGNVRFAITLDHEVYPSEELMKSFNQVIQDEVKCYLKSVKAE